MKKYEVFVTWTVGASAIVEADNMVDAIDLVHGIDLNSFKNQDYIKDSFEVDSNMVEEIKDD